MLRFAKMADKIPKLLDNVIWICFLALAILTPLIFFSGNIEIFEVPKMHFVYFTATVVLFATLIKSAIEGKFLIPKNLPFFIFIIFLAVQMAGILSCSDFAVFDCICHDF